MDAMPKALVAFYEGDSYIDVVRNAVYMGGDTDTIAAIAGSMAEGFFGMDVEEHAEVDARIEDDMRQVLSRFNVYRV